MRHLRSDAYSAEQVLLNKRQIWGGTPKLDCYQSFCSVLGTLYLSLQDMYIYDLL